MCTFGDWLLPVVATELLSALINTAVTKIVLQLVFSLTLSVNLLPADVDMHNKKNNHKEQLLLSYLPLLSNARNIFSNFAIECRTKFSQL